MKMLRALSIAVALATAVTFFAADTAAQKELWSNNAASTLAAGINNAVTSLSVAAGQGALFPTITASDYFYATIEEGSTREIVKVTARATDAFTVTRGQCGTTGQTFTSAAIIQNRLVTCTLVGLQELSTNHTGALPIANGGTGQTTLTAAFDALDPMTTQGDLLYHDGTNAVRFAKGTAGQVLHMNDAATGPEWGSKDWTVVTLSADRVSAVTSLANVTDLSFALAANTNYEIQCMLQFVANATTTGLLVSYTGATSPTSVTGIASSSAGASNWTSTADSGATTTASAVATPALNHYNVWSFYRNGANTGTWQLRFASEVAVASGITIKAGSFCKYHGIY